MSKHSLPDVLDRSHIVTVRCNSALVLCLYETHHETIHFNDLSDAMCRNMVIQSTSLRLFLARKASVNFEIYSRQVDGAGQADTTTKLHHGNAQHSAWNEEAHYGLGEEDFK